MLDGRPTLGDRLRGARRRLRAILFRRAADRDMSRELAFHLEMETEHNIRSGMEPGAARRAALLAFGGISRFTEDVRDVRNVDWLEDLRQDLRQAIRAFRRAPAFTLAAIAALSLGIGANTAVFAVVHAVVLAPLPYSEPERLVRLWESNAGQRIERSTVSPGTFVDLRERSRTLESVALLGWRTMLLSAGGESWEVGAAAVSPAFFDLLGVRTVVGTTFEPEDGKAKWAGTFDEVVISHRVWRERFGSDPGIVGRTVLMDYQWTYTIIGVMQPAFAFPDNAEIWVPLVYGRALSPNERQYRYYDAIGRMRPGVTLAQATQDAATIASRLEAEHPASNAGWTLHMAPLDRAILGNTRPALLVLLGLAGCVMLIACGNVATLAVARATARQHETAVRVALGAGRRRLLRQWTTEGLALAALGGAGGVAVGYWSAELLLAIAPTDIPRLDEVAFDGTVVLSALLATGVAGVLVGLAPALGARDTTALHAMRSRTDATSLAASRTREWLVGAQVALTLVLTVASVLLLRSFERLRTTDLGFRSEGVLSAELKVPGGRFPAPNRWTKRLDYFDRLIADVGRLPGVRSVAGTTTIPLTADVGSGSLWRTDAPGAKGQQPPTSAADQWRAAIQVVTPAYFETMAIPLARGRGFDPADRFANVEPTDDERPRPPGVAIINEAMARRFWPNGDPLGTTVSLLDDRSFASYRTIVGVVRDVRAASVNETAEPTIYLPFGQHPGRGLSLVVRSSLPAAQLVSSVRDRLRAFDAAISGSGVTPLNAIVGRALAKPRFTAALAGSFATLALVIAGIGVFGIVGFLVARRTREIGIRVALGARPSSVLWLVIREGLRPVLLGVAVGGIAAVGTAFAIRALLYDVAPLDPASFIGAAALLVATSVLAAALPAKRAAGVDPLESLRRD